MDFRREMPGLRNGEAPVTKNSFEREKETRERLTELYKSLTSLLPNPTRFDRVSILGDAIIHIKELQRTINNLKVLVEEKRCRMARTKRLEKEDEPTINMERASIKPLPLDGSLRSSRLSRKSKEAIIDVQIVDNKINIKLAQRKKGNFFLLVASLLDELQLKLLQVTGGSLRDNYIFMFNAKIGEGSSASAIARKMNELLDKEFPTFSRL
ncbi:transcription factor EAT1-like protein [Cinnamomum micranthum f. kanehirae]|uniref:Transcription factor EAT1-like protein n=1 Tax=Cinnamomum micranthum f. kanehirae TaxID=337451 RepID=A0A3S3MWW2_9MAGN|nr:transcription factor EAT1-like protein [Cinnamomum micranthum f. kanehirae]